MRKSHICSIFIFLFIAMFPWFASADLLMTNFTNYNSDSINGIIDSLGSESQRNDSVYNPNSIGLPAHNNTEEKIIIEGMLVDAETGAIPQDSTISVIVDSCNIRADSTGSFSLKLSYKQYYLIKIQSSIYSSSTQTVKATRERKNYFVTFILEKKKFEYQPTVPLSKDTSLIPWTISGSIIDSRFDIAIKSNKTSLFFDKDSIPFTSKGTFRVFTRIPGDHLFSLTIPGYHSVTKTVHLTELEKQIFIVIPTTVVSENLKRREITVSARSQDVHVTSSVSKTPISRKELQRTAATMNDPIRVTHTLPGVASESEISARPIVRGGDVQECRVTLDGISLIEPYHFGGIRSSFNQAAIEDLTFYRSGFPSEYHNAQSAIIDVRSRIPTNEKLSLEFDLNPLQHCAYLGIPLLKRRAGINLSVQGSFFDFMAKRVMGAISRIADDSYIKSMKSMINFPDYQDFSAGISIKPNNKLTIFVNNIHNTDRAKWTEGDSVSDINYYYDLNNDGTIDTVITDFNYGSYYYYNNNYKPSVYYSGLGTPDSVSVSKPYFDIDTMIDYHSRYNILYTMIQYIYSSKTMFSLSGAWQKRWWDLEFPEMDLTHSTYDVDFQQFNINAGWLYSGLQDHFFKAGLQLDYTSSRYNVNTLRGVHEFINNASTNLTDFWGPLNGDSGAVVYQGFIDNLKSLNDRIIMQYSGKRDYGNVSLYVHDAWNPSSKLSINGGTRVEISTADTSVTLSPRLSLKYNFHTGQEIIGSIGHYTQNNYSNAALALSEELTPEKAWHAGIGIESKLLPWLTQKIDIYGKFYYDLLSESIDPVKELTEEELEQILNTMVLIKDPEKLQQLIWRAIFENTTYKSHYINDGRGCSFGAEYFLRFEPADFWHGWISLTLSKSLRQRAPGWRWHNFPLERPLLISLVNYYRLPRRYELGVKYRFMSGIPYTSVSYDEESVIIGKFNDRRYRPYHRLDLKFSKGFSIKNAKGHFYFEFWNVLDIPNMILTDSKNRSFQSFSTNLPVTSLFFGIDCSY